MIKQFLFVIAGSWSVLFLLTLPFSYEIFPSIGKIFTEILLPFYNWVSLEFFGIDGATFYSSSDSIVGYIQAGFLLILSVIFGIIFLKQRTVNTDVFTARLHQVLTYLLALFLLKYGVDKLLLHQFYPPEPNTLFTPTGMLSKDILFWSTMGSSQAYNIFMGLIEVVPGLLLFHRKTRMLGSFIAIGVFANVFFINIGFDITVKLLSFVLLISSIVVFTPYFSAFKKAFFGKESAGNEISIQNPKNKRWLAIKIIAIVLISLEIISPYISLNSAKTEISAHKTISGSYEVISIQGNSKLIDLSNLRRIHFHSKGYLITEKQSGLMNDYSFQIDKKGHQIVLNRIKISLYPSENRTIYRWFENEQEIKIITQKIDLHQLPLKQDNAHWTVEGMLESATKN